MHTTLLLTRRFRQPVTLGLSIYTGSNISPRYCIVGFPLQTTHPEVQDEADYSIDHARG